MREVDRDELLADSQDPLLRHHLEPDLVECAWVAEPNGTTGSAGGTAYVVRHGVSWPDAPDGVRAALASGPPALLEGLLAEVAAQWPDPWRVVVEASAEPHLPAGWVPEPAHRWGWMLTDREPSAAQPDGHGGVEVVEVDDPDDVTALGAVAGRATMVRPDDPSVAWYGVRDATGDLVALGGLTRRASGAGHLRGIVTAPAHRGRGLATAVTAHLTRRALAGGGPAVLGVFDDNGRAIGVYERLGFRRLHSFVAGHPRR